MNNGEASQPPAAAEASTAAPTEASNAAPTEGENEESGVEKVEPVPVVVEASEPAVAPTEVVPSAEVQAS